jgi:hypothetical protein
MQAARSLVSLHCQQLPERTMADNRCKIGQSFARNMVAGAFPFFTRQLYHNLTPKWGTTLFGCLATLLAIIPFIAFFYGPQIRKRSKFAKALAAEEERINTEKEVERQARLEKNGQV